MTGEPGNLPTSAPGSAPDTLPFEVTVMRDLAMSSQASSQALEEIRWFRERWELLQGQMMVIERQLDHLVAMVSKIGIATRPAEAARIADKDANEKSEKVKAAYEDHMEALIETRGGDHPPTPDELAAAESGQLG